VRSNYFWSPDSKEIVFMHMDETKVPTYPITDWMPTHPSVDNEKYPKVGDPNPVVKLGVLDADNGKTRWLKLTDDEETYIPRFGWVREGVIWAEVLNRTEDKMDLYFVDVKSGKSRIVLTETTPGAWIDFEHNEVRFLKSSGRFLWPSWRDGNMHLYLYSFDKQNPLAADAKLEQQLTHGEFQVQGVEGVDEAAGVVFFAANKDDPRQRHIFSVKLDGSDFQSLTSGEGLHAGEFSEDGKHYLHTSTGPTTPATTSVCAVGGACSPLWAARDTVAEYGLRPPKMLEFKADDGTVLYGRLLLPPDTAAGGKIPLIVNIYGGPAAQEVTKGQPNAFDEILALARLGHGGGSADPDRQVRGGAWLWRHHLRRPLGDADHDQEQISLYARRRGVLAGDDALARPVDHVGDDGRPDVEDPDDDQHLSCGAA